MKTDKKNGADRNGGTTSVSSDSSVGEAASFPTNKRDADSVPHKFNSKKVYVDGQLYKDIHVPFREITLAPTKTISGQIEANEPVRVYDTSGPWGDPDFRGDVTLGLPPVRSQWIRGRNDVEEIEGRKVQPIDDGYLSATHAKHANGTRKSKLESRKLNRRSGRRLAVESSDLSTINYQPSTAAQRKPLRASAGRCVTQLWYARNEIITPEMEYIAVRENLGRAAVAAVADRGSENGNSAAANGSGYNETTFVSRIPDPSRFANGRQRFRMK